MGLKQKHFSARFEIQGEILAYQRRAADAAYADARKKAFMRQAEKLLELLAAAPASLPLHRSRDVP